MKETRRKYPDRIPRGRAIKLYCKNQCCAGNEKSWKNCEFYGCFLWNFRLGKELPLKQKIGAENATSTHTDLKKQALQQEVGG